MGMGSSLDSARLLNLLANESKQNVSAIEGFAFGQHNNDMIISARRMRVKSQPLDKFLSNTAIKDICHRASLRGGEIVSLLKNRSASFAPSFSCFRLIKAVVNNGFETIPVSVLLEGEYGLRNVCTGLPCVISKNGIEKIIELELDDEEKKTLLKVNETFSQLKELDYL
jgi:malate dehydrogenase